MSWLQTKPPLATFVLAVFASSFILFVLALSVASRDDLANPDVLTWNVFFEKAAKLDFCFSRDSFRDDGSASWRKKSRNTFRGLIEFPRIFNF